MSTSQIKQIGGRAGRYGLHGNSPDGGIVTTLYPEDLPVVKIAMDSDLPSISGAILPVNFNVHTSVQQAMLFGKPQFTDMLETTSLFSRTRHPYIHGEIKEGRGIAELLNEASDHFTMEDTMTWFLSPVSWRDEVARAVATRFLKDHQMRLRVDLKRALRGEKLLQVLTNTCLVMKDQRKVSNPRTTLMALETLHKSIILYMWMNQRMPVVFPDSEDALELKEKAEEAMEYVLRVMTKGASVKNVVSTSAAERS